MKFRSTFALTCEAAADQQDGKLRVSGVANSLRVTRSGRLIMPEAVQQFLRDNPTIDLPLMAQHGHTRQTFATIGRIDGMSLDPQRGLVFRGWVGNETDLQREARALIGQGAITQLSIGWICEYDRIKTYQRDEPDLPEWIAAEMDRTRRTRIWAFFQAEIYELSAVDTPDDPGARLAADLDDGQDGLLELAAGMRTLQREADDFHRELKRRLGQDKPDAQHSADADGTRAFFARLEQGFLARADEMLARLSNHYARTIEDELIPPDTDYGTRLLEAASAACEHGDPEHTQEAGGDPLESARRKLAEVTAR